MKPASLLSSREIYSGRIVRLSVDRVRLPHGVEADLEVVHHPGSVVMLCLPRPGEIVLVRQYRYCAGRELWEVPAGSLGAGEDPEAGARRECHEEIGLVPQKVVHLSTLWPTPGFCTERMLFYLCTDLVEPPDRAGQDEDEHLEVQTFALAEAWEMVRRGEIADMKTVVGLTLVRDQGA
jgi:ADP-ribose pyrophosphatase